MDEEKLKTLIAHAVSEGVSSAFESQNTNQPIFMCCKEHCEERCGFSPTEHAQKHKDADRLVTTVKETERIFSSTLIKSISVFLIGSLGVGVVIFIWQGFQQVPEFIKKIGGH